jgi:adenosylcobinamide-phosphate synthase
VLTLGIIAALVADRLFGEVVRGHPLVAFGRLADLSEERSRRWARASNAVSGNESGLLAGRQRLAGTLSWLLLIILPTALLLGLQSALSVEIATLVGIVVLYFCIGGRSLAEHAQAVALPLSAGDLHSAREQLSRIVSRDTAQLDELAVTRATIESVLENGSDALLAPLFWFAIAGAPGVLCYRLSNTLDAMWGYRNERYLNYGRTAARMDDVLNWLPARCCALSYAIAGRWSVALRCWRTQAVLCDSPNAGPVMAAGAGALGLLLGGTASYGNVPHWRPTLGEGAQPEPTDIARSLALLKRALGIWILVIALIECFTWI